jgi:1A family penicillin-binding protein
MHPVQKLKKIMSKTKHHHTLRNILFFCLSGFFLVVAGILIWLSLVDLPDFKAFEERKVANSTKIYDSTGEVLLYDTNRDIRRTEVPFENMSDYVKQATVAVEDQKFYEHNGIRVSSFVRAMLFNVITGSFSQGGSTITQQVVKNALLNQKKTITRKLKEWVLAIKLERVLTKEEILAIYLNDNPYGGTIYGVEEASQSYFGKSATDLTIAEAAYLASMPKAPSYYSPYGNHLDKLEERKNFVLSEMKSVGYITEQEYQTALAEVITFLPQKESSIKAPHFVFYIENYLETKYGAERVKEGGFTVITTIDAELQEKAEEIVKRRALENETAWEATNMALVAIDPKTGGILSMVGSRDYFDDAIDGAYNIATALRQPGSSFKPFVYATAFLKGYTPDTVLFDVPTEFQASCSPYGQGTNCYMPQNYDGKHMGPMTLRNALAQSRNVPAVQLLYLAGLKDSIKVARDMGISTLRESADYGLTLVLGGGEVSLLDMVSAYGTFAYEGVHMPHTGILKVTDRDGEILESYNPKPETVLERNTALMISDILSDNVARAPLFGSNSFLYFGGTDVAGKTGTTNNNKDAWLLGYTPTIALGVWSGNNDNTPMKKGSAISGPAWNEYMKLALEKYPSPQFPDPVYDYKNDYSVKPIFRGIWLGNETYLIDSVSGLLATEYTPTATTVEKVVPNVHSTLYWIDKNNPRGPIPTNPESDSQFENWETATQNWWNANKGAYASQILTDIPTKYDNVHTEETQLEIHDVEISPETHTAETLVSVSFEVTSKNKVSSVSYYMNGTYLGKTTGTVFSFVPGEVPGYGEVNALTISAEDAYGNTGTYTVSL